MATGSVFGRTKVLQISNCEIRDTKDVWTIVGFELVDLLNNLIWFINGTVSPIGCQFKSCRHLELSSCEVFNWANTTTNVSNMIELLDDVISTGVGTPSIFNAVVNKICVRYEMPRDELLGVRRYEHLVRARTIMINLMLEVYGVSLSELGRLLNIDHSTVIHHRRLKYMGQRFWSKDKTIHEEFKELKEQLEL